MSTQRQSWLSRTFGLGGAASQEAVSAEGGSTDPTVPRTAPGAADSTGSLPGVAAAGTEKKSVFDRMSQLSPFAGGVPKEEDVEGLPTITADELAKHTSQEAGLWLAYNGIVYDVTTFRHPGGESSLRKGLGIDATSIANANHSYIDVGKRLKARRIGRLV